MAKRSPGRPKIGPQISAAVTDANHAYILRVGAAQHLTEVAAMIRFILTEAEKAAIGLSGHKKAA